MTKHVTVQIVTYNNESDINECIVSVLVQTHTNYKIQIIDNASIDATINIIEGAIREKTQLSTNNYSIIHNKSNLGFSAAHNQGFRLSDSKYVLVLNPDVVLTSTFIEKLVKYLESDPQAGAACGKLLLLDVEGQPTSIIDSTGLSMHKNRRCFDRGQGQLDEGQYDEEEYIFGSSGAAVLYRREMLECIKTTDGITNPLGPELPPLVSDEYFDESFFAYKEDIDLSWRAQLMGWNCRYIPTAVAYHARGWQSGKRSKIPRFIQIHSFKNRYLMMIKNEEWQNLFIHLPLILLFELGALFYMAFRATFLFKGYPILLRLLKPTLEKRKQIMASKRIPFWYIRKWF